MNSKYTRKCLTKKYNNDIELYALTDIHYGATEHKSKLFDKKIRKLKPHWFK